MRLARLDLTRYGKFTDRSLDFGARMEGRPDLHIVYGPNEAGKSTAFAAYLDLLFGIRATKEPNYAFLHPYPTMRIGARLDLASGGARELVRIRRQQATLLDAEGHAVDEGLIAAELGGIGREGYRSMFSLDDDSLEQGGEEILASRGDLGEILFSGSAGAAGLSRTLEALRDEADRFFRAGAHKTRLNELKAEFDALKAERERIDTQAAPYKRLVEERDRAAAAHDAALGTRGEAAARRDTVARLLGALPQLARLRALRDALAPLLALPEPPAGWAAELPGLERDELRLDAEARGIVGEAEALARELDAIAVEAAALDLSSAHEALADLRAAAVTAAKDLPRRRPQLDAAEGAVGAALRRLGRPADADPEAAALPAATVGALRGLVAERSGVMARHDDARREAEAAAADLAEAEAALAAGGGGDAPSGLALARLAGTVEALRSADPGGRLRAAGRARAAADDRRAAALLALAPWSGGADALAALALPAPRDVDAWTAGLAGADADRLRGEGEAAALSAECHALRAEVEALGRLSGVTTEAEAVALRADRERAWASHRTRLDAASADSFEEALRRDDATAAARFGQAAAVARLMEASLALAALDVRLAAAAERADAARGRGDALRDTVAATLSGLGLPSTLTPAGLSSWLARTVPALGAIAESRDAAEAERAAEGEAAAWRERLSGALAEAGVARDPAGATEALAAVARTALDRGALGAGLAARAADARRKSRDRALALARAGAAEAEWRAGWAEACRGCWLGEGGGVPAPAAVAEVLDVLAALAPDLRSRADLRHRIDAMEADRARFAARAAPLAAALGLGEAADADPEAVLARDEAVGRRIAAARAAEASRLACRARLAAVEARRTAAAGAVAALRARSDGMRAFFAAATLAEVAAALKRCEDRDRLRGDAETLERDIRAALRVPDIGAAEALLDGVDAAALEAEGHAVAGRHDAADLDLRTHHASRVTAEAALDAVGGDADAARIEVRRRAVQLDLEEQARRFIRLRGGIAAAEQALAAYRDRHRSAMLGEASKAFRIISRNAYTGLAAQPGDRGEILIARPASGPTKQASDLSKGTRFQLYLALRVAGYHEFVKARGAVPFVADDIMETFDDVRAEEAFRLFAGMAAVGQVIYLTHHRHLIAIAREACPGLTVHDLSAA